MGNFGLAQISQIVWVALFIVGATRLPEMGRVLSRGMARFRNSHTHPSNESAMKPEDTKKRSLAA